jgi:flagellar basal-body rod modification protein FlgD
MFVSPIAPRDTSTATGATNSSTGNSGGVTDGSGLADSTNMFITLLTAELKAQDPISPLDPNEMVGQIVSLSQLDQLIQIHNVLQGSSTPAAPTNSSPASNP